MDLSDLRSEIDRLDREITSLLKERFAVAREIGSVKNRQMKVVEDLKRDQVVLENYKQLASDSLDEQFIEELVSLILKYSKEVQKK